MDCVFCKIRDGQIPSVKIYDDERTFAIMDINPLNEGHLLVIPKAHVPTVYEITEDDLGRTAVVAKRIALALQRALRPDGLNVLQANGAAAFSRSRIFTCT
jgi:histidine triad (HIT) family protein